MKWWERLRLAYEASETHDAEGRELVDSRPMEMPAGFKEPPSIQEMLAQLLSGRDVLEAQRARGDETFEDSLDFEVDDDPDAVGATAHEVRDMQEEVLREGAVAQQAAERLEAEEAVKQAAEQAKEKKKPGKGEGKKSESEEQAHKGPPEPVE